MMTVWLAPLQIFAQEPFVRVNAGHFERGGKPYYFVGTNMWYGAILGSEGRGGDRTRLCRELDLLKHNGINNLRILVGADGREGIRTKVEPSLQLAPGVYNDTILAGLDYLLAEMGKRDMVAVLYLNNSWEWSGGYGYYLEQAGCGPAPQTDVDGYPKFMDYCSQFATNTKAQQLFFDHIRFILSRTNRYTGRAYKDDPAIMSWQIANEPRAFKKEALPAFEQWLAKASALIRSLDPNHLISLGSEGAWGCEGSYDAWEKICSDKSVDYCNIHLWPYNWGWARKDHLTDDLDQSCHNTKDYIDQHLAICQRLHKPLVMEEFGYPRDKFSYKPGSPTTARDTYYKYVFSLVADNARHGGNFAGCNFWAWGGYAQPRHEHWEKGDDYCGDPSQEAQGLNSVFAVDSTTLAVVRDEVNTFSHIGESTTETATKTTTTQHRQALRATTPRELRAVLASRSRKGIMIGHQDDPFYGTTWKYEEGRSDMLEAVGVRPMVLGCELGGLELGWDHNIDGVPFTTMFKEIQKQVARGGIVTLSWHPHNPVTGGDAWDVEGNAVTAVLPGGAQNAKFKEWLSTVANFLKSLKTAKGQTIPVIFRPWHEMNGTWFWWGKSACTPNEYKQLFQYTVNTFAELGVRNLLYCYSPNIADQDETIENYMKYYPGDQYVSILGTDIYATWAPDKYVHNVKTTLDVIQRIAQQHHKLMCFSETGYQNTPDKNWFYDSMWQTIRNYPLSYVLLWRDAWDKPKENFGPVPGTAAAENFKKIVADPRCLK